MDYYKNQSYYDVLGVEPTASIESIERAKNRLKFGDSESRAPFSMWDKIDEAYVVLSNPTKRIEYDMQIKQKAQDNDPKNNNNTSDDIYSNSDHKIHSLVNNLQDTFTLPKLKKVGKNLVLALPTATVATIKIIKELEKREEYSLQKESEEKEIKEVKTEESQLEEKYRKELEENIDKKLREYHFNYDLEIDKLRYENHIELLRQKIMIKENQVVEKAGLLKYKLELTALIKQLHAFEKSLEVVNEKINNVNENRGKQKLTRIHENLIEVDKQIKEQEHSTLKRTFALKKLQVRKNNLLKKFNLKIDKVKSSREYYAIFKDSLISAYAVTENFVENLFVPIDEIDEKVRNR